MVALALCALPGLYAWLSGRRLAGRLDDPLLPERLQRHRQQVTQVAVPAILAALWLSGGSLLIAALGSLLTVAGFFPLRRAVFSESWGLPAYLGHQLRLLLGLAGPLLLVALAPVVALAIGPPLWVGGLGCAVLALCWAHAAAPLLVRLLGARPLQRPDLMPHLEPVTARARVPAPELLEAGPPGALWANAFALLRRERDAVLFTRSLLAEFPPDELGAIHAHELAHLEHLDSRARRRRSLAFVVLVLLGCFVWPGLLESLSGRAGAGTLTLLAWAWTLLVLLAMLVGQAGHQAHEAESDRRAVELCQDPEALVRGLVRLSSLARLPRRFAPDLERASTHPSLARRIQAIRGQAPGPASALPATAVASTTAGAWAIVEASRSHWLEGVPDGTLAEPAALLAAAARSESVSHGELVELRLEVTGAGVRLRATERGGRVRSLPIPEDEVARVQAALDHADAQLGIAAPHDNRLALAAGVLAPLLLLLAASGGAWSALLPGLVAVLHAGPASLGGLGAAALGEAVIRASHPPGTLAAPFLGAFGAVAVAVAGVRLRRGGPARPWPALAAVLASGLPTLLVLLLVGSGGLAAPRLARLHQAAAASPRGAVLALATAAALALGPWRAARWAALPLAGIAAALFGIGSSLFALGPGADPALGPVGRIIEHSLPAEVLRETRLTRPAAHLRISPAGRRFAVRIGDDEGTRFWLGDFQGSGRELPALDLGFLGEERLAVLEQAGEQTALVVCDLSLQPLSTQQLPALQVPRLLVDGKTGRWRVLGSDARGDLLLVEGDLQGHQVLRLALPAPPVGRYHAPYTVGRSALLVRRGLEVPEVGDFGAYLPILLGLTPGGPSHLQVVTEQGPGPELDSSLPLSCVEPPPGVAELLCLASDPRGTALALFREGQVRGAPLGRLRGYASPDGSARGPGLLAILRWSAEVEGQVALLDPERSGEAQVLTGLPPSVAALAAGDGVLGLLAGEAAGARVVVVRLPGS